MSERHITPHPKKPGIWIINLGGGTYETSEAGTCTCPGFQFRGRCKHAEALAEQIEAERCCPACHGYGQLFLRASYPSKEPIPCVVCDQSGLKQPEMSDEELRKIFA